MATPKPIQVRLHLNVQPYLRTLRQMRARTIGAIHRPRRRIRLTLAERWTACR